MARSSATVALHLAAFLALIALQEGIERDRIGLHGIDASGGEILVGLVLRLVFLDCRAALGEMLLGVVLMHGRNLHADRLALQTFRCSVELLSFGPMMAVGVL